MKKLESKALRYVGTLARTLNSKSDLKFKQIGLQKGQYIFLTRICENPKTNLANLTEMVKVDKATTTKAVQKLINLGYISKQQNKKDKREFELIATEKGLEIYKIIINEERKHLEFSFDGFSEEEVKMATYLIEKMSKNIEKYWLDKDLTLYGEIHE
ncbi:DNA-binding transcriptional regulator, MarR family [Terribacillus halophilus]|uniref:DNA-binding transcriptional regulator, MarR family n=1 Tax=Terribacillus halophilus TaxID=361279 RepID=A0A1G6J555_9BACI|nr:MarR family winged helix-turn-helix transcriptional regulator [Terribacillus halophilus]SDC13851.1 DNA-binding transcriptional regulator, MarR family [Terribacillus halophilus]